MEHGISEEKFDEIAKELVVSNIDDVLSGNADKETILDYLGLIAAKIMRKEPLPEEFAYVIYRISKGEDANIALGLEIPHRSKGDAGQKRTIALSVWYAVNFQKHSVETAFILTGKKFNKSPSTVREIYYQYKEEIEMKLLSKSGE